MYSHGSNGQVICSVKILESSTFKGIGARKNCDDQVLVSYLHSIGVGKVDIQLPSDLLLYDSHETLYVNKGVILQVILLIMSSC